MGNIAVDTPDEGSTKVLHSKSIKCGHLEDTPIFKARSDKRHYRRIALANGMQVLLVSDPETDLAAASIDVHVGSFCDPDELPGLAHFLEHMLFFSNKKYPEEGSFSKFLGAHGGCSNAYTGCENTNFQFDVGADHLEEALDRFAQFFICPLFVDDATSREVRAVDSENSRNLKSDAHRLSQVESHFTSTNHPQHRFTTGNLQTLEEVPKAKGIDTRAEMLKFYNDHYSSNLMCLTVYGKESLDELQLLVEDKFSAVKNLEHEVVHFRGQPCSAEHIQILVKAVPVMEGHVLKLSWPVTPSNLHYREGPLQYTSHLVGHEGHGSLLVLLKQLGWVNSLEAGESSYLHSSFFIVKMSLTDVGQEHMEEIVAFTFQYLGMLQKEGVASWIFDEIKAVSDMKFHFQDKYSPFHYTSAIAENMRLFPPEDWLVADLPRTFAVQVISNAIEQLVPERVRIFSYSKKHTKIATEVEPWYGTHFTSVKIDDALIKQWRSADVDPRLQLPAPNDFIPTDFSILNADSKVQVPFVLRATKMSTLWYKPDTKFYTPKAKICMQFDCPESNISPEASLLTRIFAAMVWDYLNAYAYNARMAGLSYHFLSTIDGFILYVAGFNSKLIYLAEKILEVIVNFAVKEDRFHVVKEMVLKDLMNSQFQQPLDQAEYNCAYLLIHKKFYYTDLLEVLPNLSAEDLQQMIPRLFSRVFLECFISGNITSKQAEDFIAHVEKSLSSGPVVKSKPAFPSQLMEQRIVRMENGANFTYPTVGRNPDDENSALCLHLQLGQDDTELNIRTELLVLMMFDAAFHQLRTIEQLGYVVYTHHSNLFGVRGIEFRVQSTVKDPEAIEVRVEAFLEQFGQTLENMSEDVFQTHVKSWINVKLEKDKNIWEEIAVFWYEMIDGTMKFKRAEVEVAAVRDLQKQTLIDFYRMHVQRDAPRRRKLSCQVYGSKHLEEYKAMVGKSTVPVKEVVSAAGKEQVEILNSHAEEATASVEKPVEMPNSHTENGPSTTPMKPMESSNSHMEERACATVKETAESPSSQTEDKNVPQPDEEEEIFAHCHYDNKQSVQEATSKASEVHQEEVKPKSQVQLIHDMNAFKRTQSLYSSLWSGMVPITDIKHCLP